jgi:hypothetical protein
MKMNGILIKLPGKTVKVGMTIKDQDHATDIQTPFLDRRFTEIQSILVEGKIHLDAALSYLPGHPWAAIDQINIAKWVLRRVEALCDPVQGGLTDRQS